MDLFLNETCEQAVLYHSTMNAFKSEVISSSHCETVVYLSQQKPDTIIRVGIDLKPEDVTNAEAESKAGYTEIKDYIEEKYGFKVSNLYIAQAKEILGIKERENYNLPKNENSRVPKCPPEKMDAIKEALRHFKMI